MMNYFETVANSILHDPSVVLFPDPAFLFRFLPALLAVYYLAPKRFRNAVLFLASILFYAMGEPRFVLLLLGLTVFNYLMGQRIYRCHSAALLAFTVFVNIGVLTACKILALTVNAALLPLGLSFYVFKMISYVVDLRRGTIVNRPTFLTTAAYFAMFPQVTQGPVMRYQRGGFDLPDPADRIYTMRHFEDGCCCFTIGFAMKVLLADRLAILWNELVKIGFESISTPLAWLGAYGYTFRLYFDFWGYSMMAAGLGMLLGFPFVENFHHPYAAGSVTEFYRDWHVTLGTWFRDYVYIPLGGSRRGNARTIRNLLIVWILTGFWHGGTLNFILWGLVLGLLILWEKFVVRRLLAKAPLLGHFHVWFLIPLTWVIFAIPDLHELGVYFLRLFPFAYKLLPAAAAGGAGAGALTTAAATTAASASDALGALAGAEGFADFFRYLKMFAPFLAASVVLCVPQVTDTLIRKRRRWWAVPLFFALFWLSVYRSVVNGSNAFMYFSF